jgi:ankyrin repeat protein
MENKKKLYITLFLIISALVIYIYQNKSDDLLQLYLMIKSDDKEGLKDFLKQKSGQLSEVINLPIDHYSSEVRTGENALFYAIKLTSFEIVEILLQHGADVNYQNDSGDTALHLAIYYKNGGIVGISKKQKKDLSKIISLLIKDHNIDLTKKNNQNENASIYAKRKKDLKILNEIRLRCQK